MIHVPRYFHYRLDKFLVPLETPFLWMANWRWLFYSMVQEPLKLVARSERANGVRYPLVGGTRQRHFAGTNFKPRKLLENAQTPTSRVHAVLGGDCLETDY
jgi:hypothetical protein